MAHRSYAHLRRKWFTQQRCCGQALRSVWIVLKSGRIEYFAVADDFGYLRRIDPYLLNHSLKSGEDCVPCTQAK